MADFRPELWAIPVLAAMLVAAAVTDLRKGRIYNLVTYPAMAAGLVVQTWLNGTDGLTRAALGLAVGFVPLLVCWLIGGIRGGDVKLMGAVGALTNWRFALAAMYFAFAIVAVMAVYVMIRRRIVRRTLGRIWRTLYLALVPKSAGLQAASGPDSPKLPFGLALCLGAMAALADALLGGPITVKLAGL